MFEKHYYPISEIKNKEFNGLNISPGIDFKNNGFRVETEIKKTQSEVADTLIHKNLDPFLFRFCKKVNSGWTHTGEFPDNLSKIVLPVVPHSLGFKETTNYFLQHQRCKFPKPVASVKPSLKFLKHVFNVIETPRKGPMVKKSIERYKKSLAESERISLSLFPQGTRNPNKRGLYRGFYKAAEYAKAPIVFMTINHLTKNAHISDPLCISHFEQDKHLIIEYLQDKLPHEEIFFWGNKKPK